MRLLKSFRLLHRRVKSDTTVAIKLQRVKTVPRSKSTDQLCELDLANETIEAAGLLKADNAAKELPTSAAVESINAKELPAHPSVVLVAKDYLDNLETSVASLEQSNTKWATDFAEVHTEMSYLKCNYYDALGKGVDDRRKAKADAAKIQDLTEKVEHQDRFIKLLSDVGIDEPVFPKAHASMQRGEDFEEALVDAIKSAASNWSSPWAKIIPAVTGPRTSDEYVSAIKMTISTRKDLKETEKKKAFWKQLAQEDEQNMNTITPSSSNLDDVVKEEVQILSPERQSAVDDLLVKLRRGEYPARRWTSTDVEMVTPRPGPASGPVRLSQIEGDESAVDTAGLCSNSATTTHTHYVPNIPPLASDVLKETSSVPCSERCSRPVLGEVDQNVPQARAPVSTKALGKRRGMIVSQNLESLEASENDSQLEVPNIRVSLYSSKNGISQMGSPTIPESIYSIDDGEHENAPPIEGDAASVALSLSFIESYGASFEPGPPANFETQNSDNDLKEDGFDGLPYDYDHDPVSKASSYDSIFGSESDCDDVSAPPARLEPILEESESMAASVNSDKKKTTGGPPERSSQFPSEFSWVAQTVSPLDDVNVHSELPVSPSWVDTLVKATTYPDQLPSDSSDFSWAAETVSSDSDIQAVLDQVASPDNTSDGSSLPFSDLFSADVSMTTTVYDSPSPVKKTVEEAAATSPTKSKLPVLRDLQRRLSINGTPPGLQKKSHANTSSSPSPSTSRPSRISTFISTPRNIKIPTGSTKKAKNIIENPTDVMSDGKKMKKIQKTKNTPYFHTPTKTDDGHSHIAMSRPPKPPSSPPATPSRLPQFSGSKISSSGKRAMRTISRMLS